MRNLSEIARQLEASSDGIWTARTISKVSYPESGNDIYFAIEDQSFWFRHRNDCILEAVRMLPPPRDILGGTIFDVGGGNGFVAKALQDAGWDVVLVEPGARGAMNAHGRGVRQVVRAAFEDAGFAADSLPAIGLFDVVEHTPDDRAFLGSLAHALAKGGRIYLTAPAGRWLWSHEDVLAGHYRRYNLSGLRSILTAAGLEVEYATCFFGFFPFPMLLRRVLPYRLGLGAMEPTAEQVRADHVLGGSARKILGALLRRELHRIRSGRLSSFGGSCLAVARKR